jgi:hypothetical protein
MEGAVANAMLRVSTMLLGIVTAIGAPAVLAMPLPAPIEGRAGVTQTGTGLWLQSGRAAEKITRATLVRKESNAILVQFQFRSGGLRTLSGIAELGSEFFRVRLTHAESANSSGTLLIETGPRYSIHAMFGTGLLDGQPFAMQFSKMETLASNLSAAGEGVWQADGAAEASLHRVSLMVDAGGKAELAFFLTDGSVRRLSGVAKRSPASESWVVSPTSSGMADASGEVKLLLRAQDQLAGATGAVTIDGRAVQIRFEVEIQPKPAPAEVIDAALGTLKRIEGAWTQGDATTRYVAYLDDSWVRRIDATIDQADYGSSRRRLYFVRDVLVYYTEIGSRRDPSAGGKGGFDDVALAISFPRGERAPLSQKTVNGKPATPGETDVVGAVNYSNELRRQVEENAIQEVSPADRVETTPAQPQRH